MLSLCTARLKTSPAATVTPSSWEWQPRYDQMTIADIAADTNMTDEDWKLHLEYRAATLCQHPFTGYNGYQRAEIRAFNKAVGISLNLLVCC